MRFFAKCLAIFSFLASTLVWAQDEAIEPDVFIGLADDAIVITSGFDGTNVVVFGTVEGVDRDAVKPGDYQVVIVLAGPRERITVRQKQRKVGIWVNGDAVNFRNAPSSYSIASSAPLQEVATSDVLAPLQLGFEHLAVEATGGVGEISAEKANLFTESLVRLKQSQSLYRLRDDAVKFLNPTLFRARLEVPANVPIGHHRARAYLFHKGEFLTTRSVLLEVRKSGVEQGIYDLAYRNGLIYGLLAVLMAMVTGWLASVILRKD